MNKKKMNLCEKILNIALDIFIVIFGFILLVSIYNNIQIKILGNSYSSFFGYSTFEVQTGSMADTINPGDWIIVKYAKNVKLDDIITFEKDGEFITHRVIEVYKTTYVTRGDANNAKDDAISKNQVVGKVIKIIPNFGIIRKTLFNPIVLLTLIVMLYVFSFAFKNNKSSEVGVSVNTTKIREFFDLVIKKIRIFIKNLIKLIKNKESKEINKIEEKPVNRTIKKKRVKKIKEEVPVVEPIKDEVAEQLEKINSEEDLDKTVFFRMVPVDKMEIDNTYLKIAETQIDEVKETKVVTIEEEELDDDSLIKSNLEMLQNKKKKCKNIVEKCIFIKSEELNEIINILNENAKLKSNEATIKEELMNTYIDAKYYNYCGDVNVEYNSRNMVTRIEETIKTKATDLTKKYKGSDNHYNDKVKKYTNIFILINYLEQANSVIDELQPKRELYKNKMLKYFMTEAINPLIIKNMIDRIIKTQRIYCGMIEYSLKKLETNIFNLVKNPVNSKKNLSVLELEHNLNFSKVYSDYIVDKTYTEGIIAEDKIVILISLLLIEVTHNMFNGDASKKYILYLPETLYEKDNKLDKMFKMFEDEFAKNSVIVLVKYSNLLKHKKLIKDLKKEGYKFAFVFDEDKEIKGKDSACLSLAEYLFVDKKLAKSTNIISMIPSDLQDIIIYDNILTKVGNNGGE